MHPEPRTHLLQYSSLIEELPTRVLTADNVMEMFVLMSDYFINKKPSEVEGLVGWEYDFEGAYVL